MHSLPGRPAVSRLGFSKTRSPFFTKAPIPPKGSSKVSKEVRRRCRSYESARIKLTVGMILDFDWGLGVGNWEDYGRRFTHTYPIRASSRVLTRQSPLSPLNQGYG